MKRLLVSFMTFATTGPAMADVVLACEMPLDNNLGRVIGKILMDFELTADKKLTENVNVKTEYNREGLDGVPGFVPPNRPHNYGKMKVHPNSSFYIDGEKTGYVNIDSPEDFMFFGFVLNKFGDKYMGTLDVVFKGKNMPAEGTNDYEPGREYFEDTVACVLQAAP